MRPPTATLDLALCLLGCSAEPVRLLTGSRETCSVRAGPPVDIQGVLVSDPESGTAIHVDRSASGWAPVMLGSTMPVRWPTGYTGRRLPSGEVEVLNGAGEHVATTGRHVLLLLESTPPFGSAIDGAFPACGGRESP
jgi:hypothetical protein